MKMEFTDDTPEDVLLGDEPEFVFGLEVAPLLPGFIANNVVVIIENESEGTLGLSFRTNDGLPTWQLLGLLHAALRAAERDYDSLLPGWDYDEYEAFGEGEE